MVDAAHGIRKSVLQVEAHDPAGGRINHRRQRCASEMRSVMRRKLMWGLELESAMRLSRRMRAGYPCELLAILLVAAPAAHAQDAGAESSDRFGDAVARGDFNGDGYDDLAVGLPFEDRTNFPGAPIIDAGAVDVIYGTAIGLQAAHRQLLRQGFAGIDNFAEVGDHFG